MKKITFEEYLKLSEEEQDKIIHQAETLNEEEWVVVENPIKDMNDQETLDYFHKLGAMTLEEVEEKINEMFDKYAARKEPGSETTDSEQ